MQWYNNLKVATKLYVGFGINIALLFSVLVFIYFALESVRSAQHDAFTSQEVNRFLEEKWSDHLMFVKNLDESILLGKEFTGQLDPTQCAFGKWYTTFAPSQGEMREAFEHIDLPHRLLHEHAARIRTLQRMKGNRAEQLNIYATTVVPVLDQVKLRIKNLAAVIEKNAMAQTHRSEEAIQSVQVGLLALMPVSFMLALMVSLAVSRMICKPVKRLSAQAELVAGGDLTVEVTVTSKDEVGQLSSSFKTMIESLHETIAKVGEASSAVASTSAQISSSTEEMAAGAQEQTSQAGEVASAVEEMTKTIIENSRNASSTAETAKQAKESAEQGGKVVSETVHGMKRIAEVVNKSARTVQDLGKSSDQIGKIIGVIDDIADQTNLLALNAAIEAARAGEQGRGFAVVADEVRKLAERTTKATKEIAEMIKKIQEDTQGAVSSMEEGTAEVEQGIKLADQAGASLQEIVSTSQRVTDMVMQIAAASEQQSSASEQISKNVEAISAVTQQTASGTQQIARAAEDLNRLTENLQQMIAKFKLSDHQAKQAQPLHQTRIVQQKETRKRGQLESSLVVGENGSLFSHK